MEELAVLLAVGFALCCQFHPISLVLPKETDTVNEMVQLAEELLAK